MRYKRAYSRVELAKMSFEKTKALPTRLAVLDSSGKKWVLPGTLESLAKENSCSGRTALKMFHAMAKACRAGQLDPALFGAVAA